MTVLQYVWNFWQPLTTYIFWLNVRIHYIDDHTEQKISNSYFQKSKLIRFYNFYTTSISTIYEYTRTHHMENPSSSKKPIKVLMRGLTQTHSLPRLKIMILTIVRLTILCYFSRGRSGPLVSFIIYSLVLLARAIQLLCSGASSSSLFNFFRYRRL